jgi:hypothetical protein
MRGGVCPGAMPSAETKQGSKIAVKAVEDLISSYVDYVVEALAIESSKRLTTVQSRTTSLAFLLIPNRNLVEIYLRNIWQQIEMRIVTR